MGASCCLENHQKRPRSFPNSLISMPQKNDDLHGNAPDSSPVALLLIDVINDLEFVDGEELFASALPMAKNLATLKRQAKQMRIPVIYANDNFGKWRSDFNTLTTRCLTEPVRGRPIVELLKPDDDDYFILKPKQSGFFSTALDILLRHLGVNTLIITGISTHICVLFTAIDAYMRDFRLLVPCNCVASASSTENRDALAQMRTVLKADTRPTADLNLKELGKA